MTEHEPLTDDGSTHKEPFSREAPTNNSSADSLVRPRRAHIFLLLERLVELLSPAERLVLYVFSIGLGLSLIMVLSYVNRAISIEVPTLGGTIVEGETTPARFINPLLALSQADQDLSQLVYSGLTRTLPDGSIVPDLADHFDISSDGTTYTFVLRPQARFSDGKLVTSEDVAYTIKLAQNPEYKSIHRADWEGVEVTTPDAQTVVFRLPHGYAPFLENTAIGILPKHLWSKVSPEDFPFAPLNTHPIGSGAYKVDSVLVDSTGAPNHYLLVPNTNFALGSPHIARIEFTFYPNDAALLKAFLSGKVDSLSGVDPSAVASTTKMGTTIMRAPLPRVYGIFFNQSHNPALTDSAVRAALTAAVDKKMLVQQVLGGYGTAIDSPIPPGIISLASSESETTASSTTREASRDIARATLMKGGWAQNASATSTGWSKNKVRLSIKLATADEPGLIATAKMVARMWQDIGIPTDVHVYPLSEFNTTVLRPRDYDAILFGEVVGREADLFAFWHSSQRNDPGLNLALYANASADALLSKARAATNKIEREKLYVQFAALIKKDNPATFLYSPEFVYIVPGNLRGVQIGAITTPSERFLNVYQWYTTTEHVWSFFTDSVDTYN